MGDQLLKIVYRWGFILVVSFVLYLENKGSRGFQGVGNDGSCVF